MSFPKILTGIAFIIFGGIAVVAVIKKNVYSQRIDSSTPQEKHPIEISLKNEPSLLQNTFEKQENAITENLQSITREISEDNEIDEIADHVDRIQEFFNKQGLRLPIVQTITYKSHVSWLKDRPAWIADYASHYKTSRHFIARSLNEKIDYEKQDVSDGDKFNVFREDKDFEFYLVVNLDLCKMRFYYIDKTTGERVLLKTYLVGVGRSDENKESKFLTPLGRFTLGNKIAIYKPKNFSYHQGEKTEMIRIFGTRWIPFGEVENDEISNKGLGIHGLPWLPNEKGELVEITNSLGKPQSDGCIRLATKDIEELFAIVITKPTTIEIVKGIHN
jgi:hypothetical protein